MAQKQQTRVSQLKQQLLAVNKRVKQAKESGNRRQLRRAREERLSLWRELRNDFNMAPPPHVAKEIEKRDREEKKERKKKPAPFKPPGAREPEPEQQEEMVFTLADIEEPEAEYDMVFTEADSEKPAKKKQRKPAKVEHRLVFTEADVEAGELPRMKTERATGDERFALETWIFENNPKHGQYADAIAAEKKAYTEAVRLYNDNKNKKILADKEDLVYALDTTYGSCVRTAKRVGEELEQMERLGLRDKLRHDDPSLLIAYDERVRKLRRDKADLEQTARSRMALARKEFGHKCRVRPLKGTLPELRSRYRVALAAKEGEKRRRAGALAKTGKKKPATRKEREAAAKEAKSLGKIVDYLDRIIDELEPQEGQPEKEEASSEIEGIKTVRRAIIRLKEGGALSAVQKRNIASGFSDIRAQFEAKQELRLARLRAAAGKEAKVARAPVREEEEVRIARAPPRKKKKKKAKLARAAPGRGKKETGKKA